MKDVSYGASRTIAGSSYDDALGRVKAALKAEGFGVLTEIDVSKTLKEKLGVEFPRYAILGACNPPLAHRALQGEPEIGLLLPCNVVVAEDADGGVSVAVIKASEMFKLLANAEVEPIAREVDTRLQRVLAAI